MAKAKSPQRGRPLKYEAGTKRKTSISFQLEHIVWLDGLCLQVLANNGVIVDRSDFIRAAVEALQQSGIDFSKVKSPAEVRELILKRFK